MPYKEGGEEQGGAGAQVAGGGRVTDAQAAFEREYGTKVCISLAVKIFFCKL